MQSVKDSIFYNDVLQEQAYDFGMLYVFKNFIVAENNHGITYNWEEHGKQVVEDVSKILQCKGNDVIYISNGINSYAVVPNDWNKFFSKNLSLKAYGIVGQSHVSAMSSNIENLFFSKRIKRFQSLEPAIEWVRNSNYDDIDAYD